MTHILYPLQLWFVQPAKTSFLALRWGCPQHPFSDSAELEQSAHFQLVLVQEGQLEARHRR